jgi:hypothetical protein
LASNLTSAMSVAGPTVAGAEPTVSGTDRLVAWARTIRVRAQRAAAARRNRNSDNRRTPAPADNSSGGSSQPPRTTDCGGGVIAGPNTSCSFALNVRDAWLDAPGTTNTVRVFSPVTNETYTMSCSPSGRGVSCSGANDASVTFGG